MKIQLKSKFYCLSALSVLGVALSANNVRAQDDTPIEMPPSSAKLPMQIDTQSFLWRLHLQPGAKYQMRLFSRTTSTQNVAAKQGIPAEKVEVKVLQRMNLDYDVLSVDSFGASTVRVTYRDITMDANTSLNGREIAGPAEKGMATKTNQYLADVYKNQSLEIKFAPDGQIWSIVGLKTLKNRLSQALTGLFPQERNLFKTQFSAFLDEQQIKTTFGQVKGALPLQPVRVGESWTYTIPPSKYGPMTVNMEGKRTLNKLANQEAYVQENATMVMSSDDFETESGSFKIKDLKGNMTGASRVDVNSGLAKETNMKTQFSMTIEVNNRGQKSSIPAEAITTTRVVVEPR